MKVLFLDRCGSLGWKSLKKILIFVCIKWRAYFRKWLMCAHLYLLKNVSCFSARTQLDWQKSEKQEIRLTEKGKHSHYCRQTEEKKHGYQQDREMKNRKLDRQRKGNTAIWQTEKLKTVIRQKDQKKHWHQIDREMKNWHKTDRAK